MFVSTLSGHVVYEHHLAPCLVLHCMERGLKYFNFPSVTLWLTASPAHDSGKHKGLHVHSDMHRQHINPLWRIVIIDHACKCSNLTGTWMYIEPALSLSFSLSSVVCFRIWLCCSVGPILRELSCFWRAQGVAAEYIVNSPAQTHSHRRTHTHSYFSFNDPK